MLIVLYYGMTLIDKLVAMGTGKKNNLILWGVIAVSTIVFFVGIGISRTSGINIKPLSTISLRAASMEYKATYSGRDKKGQAVQLDDAYHWTISKPVNIMQSIPYPITANSNIVFHTDSPYIGFERDTIPAGGMVTVLLKKYDGRWGFSDPDPRVNVDEHTIYVYNGNTRIARIFVRIILNDEDFDITGTLENNATGLFAPTPTVLVSHLTKQYLNNDTIAFKVRYRVRIVFRIWDEIIYDSDIDGYGLFTYKELYQLVGAIPPPDYASGQRKDDTIVLFEHADETADGTPNDYISVNQEFRNIDRATNIVYQLTCNYNGTPFTKSNLKIRVVV